KLGSSVRALDQLVEVFVRGSNRAYNKKADYHFLASVFADVTQIPDGRSFFLEKSPVDGMLALSKLMCFTEHPAIVRRGGVISTIKNCCFDTESHMILLSDELGLLPYVLLPLCGAEEFDEDDMEGMPDDLQLLPDDKVREIDERLRRTLLEALVLLTTTRSGRDMMRQRKVYPIVRNMHLAEQSEDVKEVAERVVQMLMRDEMDHAGAVAPAGAPDTNDDEETRIVEV
ncbi:putative DNA-binding protein HGH1, partial [Thamnocephalis sphaerospora]